MNATLAATLVACAVFLSRPVPRGALASRSTRVVATVITGSACVVLLRDAPWGLAAPALIAGAALAGFYSVRVRQRHAAGAARTGASVQEVCEVLSAELGAGLPVDRCLEEAVTAWPPLAGVARAHALGGSVPDALRELAVRPGAGDLRLVAAAWQVASRTGSGLAESLSEVGQTLRAREATRRVVRSELASARSTARLMAFLPVLTLVMGSGVGGDPVRFLLSTPLGLGCLGAGLLLTVVGLRWIESISAGVEAAT